MLCVCDLVSSVQLDGTRIAGWVVYSLLTCVWFIFLKTLNFRLHKALGSDPVPESEESNSQEEDGMQSQCNALIMSSEHLGLS